MQTTSSRIQSIEEITRETITTREAAYHLNLKEQTLRCWAMRENGLLKPVRIANRLNWRVADIKKLLGIA